jgi:hypothetical protein
LNTIRRYQLVGAEEQAHNNWSNARVGEFAAFLLQNSNFELVSDVGNAPDALRVIKLRFKNSDHLLKIYSNGYQDEMAVGLTLKDGTTHFEGEGEKVTNFLTVIEGADDIIIVLGRYGNLFAFCSSFGKLFACRYIGSTVDCLETGSNTIIPLYGSGAVTPSLSPEGKVPCVAYGALRSGVFYPFTNCKIPTSSYAIVKNFYIDSINSEYYYCYAGILWGATL